MNQSLSAYNPPSFFLPSERDYQSFINAVRDYLENELSQYQIQFIQKMIDVLNTGTQAFGSDIVAVTTIAPTNWAHRIAGTGTIQTITPPNGFQSFIVLLSLNGFTFAGGGNISNPTVVTMGHPALCIFDPTAAPSGQKWWILTA
jgi:hypothetical protein